ncbi:hypothetical protein GQ55_1G298100 [Panicum hallii var. hallii]|uniref:Uncharacterized protein n=1 Tax=Panicum hallii var. hallii TaxID=1504633 RepID=A0A2T7F8Z3_9POAL|nr:hypothetical protein GQ55_1G298100 [Panicum hallii var. hallii]
MLSACRNHRPRLPPALRQATSGLQPSSTPSSPVLHCLRYMFLGKPIACAPSTISSSPSVRRNCSSPWASATLFNRRFARFVHPGPSVYDASGTPRSGHPHGGGKPSAGDGAGGEDSNRPREKRWLQYLNLEKRAFA